MTDPPAGVSSRRLLAFGALVALAATSGSLYFSLGLGLVPCTLCWYQRILMYPLVVVFGVAAVENRPTAYRTAVPLAAPGAALAAYHSWLQATRSGARCAVGGGCTFVQLRVLGLSIPNLALVGFTLILGTAVALWGRERPV